MSSEVNPPRYQIQRDNKIVFTSTPRGHHGELECWNWIHSHTPFSVSHAIRHEGYRIVPVQDPVP